MLNVKSRPLHVAAAVRDLGEALAKTAPEFGEKFDAEQASLTSRLGAHWMFRACCKAAMSWPKRSDVTWTSNDTIGDFLDKFDISATPPTT